VLACPRVRALGGIPHGGWLSGPLRYQPGRPARRRRRDCRYHANIRSCREARRLVKHQLAGECQASPGTGHALGAVASEDFLYKPIKGARSAPDPGRQRTLTQRRAQQR
jgi:hypothetical protein